MEKGMYQNHSTQIANAGSSVAAATGVGRRANNFYADYLRMVDAEMVSEAAIKYLEIYKSLNGDLQAMKGYADDGVSPRDFVNRVIVDFGLKRNEAGNDRDEVERHNRVQAAIAGFAMEDPEWTLGTNGVVYKETDTGLLSMVPIAPPAGGPCWIGILEHEGASLVNGSPRGLDVGQEIACEYDIREAVDAAQAALENRSNISY